MENHEETRQKTMMRRLKVALSKQDAMFTLTILVMIMITWILIYLFFVSADKNQSRQIQLESRQNQVMAMRLNDVQSTLKKMSSNLPDSEFKTTLQQLSSNVNDVGKHIADTAKTVDVKQLSTQLTEIKSDIDDLQKMLSDSIGLAYSNPKLLPFQITAMDVISGQPFITIAYDHHLWPMGIGDVIAAWQLVSVDYRSETAEFVNDAGQRVKISNKG